MTEQQIIDQLDQLRKTMPHVNSWRIPTYAITRQYASRARAVSWDITFYRGNGTMIEGQGKTLDAAWRDFLGQLSRSPVTRERETVSVLIPGGEDLERFDFADQ